MLLAGLHKKKQLAVVVAVTESLATVELVGSGKVFPATPLSSLELVSDADAEEVRLARQSAKAERRRAQTDRAPPAERRRQSAISAERRRARMDRAAAATVFLTSAEVVSPWLGRATAVVAAPSCAALMPLLRHPVH